MLRSARLRYTCARASLVPGLEEAARDEHFSRRSRSRPPGVVGLLAAWCLARWVWRLLLSDSVIAWEPYAGAMTKKRKEIECIR